MDTQLDRPKHRIAAIQLAYAILDAEAEVTDLRRENARLAGIEQKYTDLLSENIRHSEAMTNGIVNMYTALSERKGDPNVL